MTLPAYICNGRAIIIPSKKMIYIKEAEFSRNVYSSTRQLFNLPQYMSEEFPFQQIDSSWAEFTVPVNASGPPRQIYILRTVEGWSIYNEDYLNRDFNCPPRDDHDYEVITDNTNVDTADLEWIDEEYFIYELDI